MFPISRFVLAVSLCIAPVLAAQAQDADGDGIPDSIDNCRLVPNANQRDTNGDGFGNICDPDFNGDGIVNINDFNRLKARLGISPVVDVDTDLDGNGAVNVNDLNRLKSYLGLPPGPGAASSPPDPNRFLRFLTPDPAVQPASGAAPGRLVSPGLYNIVAATFATGQAGNFTITATDVLGGIQTFNGFWTNSGGRNPTSPNNPVFVLDGRHTGPLKISLSSPAINNYLYLLDANGQIVAEDDDSGGSGQALIKLDALIDNDANALAYYAAIDPTNQKTTLNAWKTANGFDAGFDALAIYVNDADLGFGRRMFTRKNADGSIASYVENYGDNQGTVNGPAEEKITNAKNRTNRIATVAMEYRQAPTGVLGRGVFEGDSQITRVLTPGTYQAVLAKEGAGASYTLLVTHQNASTQSSSGVTTVDAYLGTDHRPESPVNPRLSFQVTQTEAVTVSLTTNGGGLLYLLGPGGPFITTFYTFGANDQRITAADLDGRGPKSQPGVCTVCHGGFPKQLVRGVYPDNGDAGAYFLPWDLDTLVFSTTDSSLSRATQESQFKIFNQTVLATYPVPASFAYTGPPVTVPGNSTAEIQVPLQVSGAPSRIDTLVASFDHTGGGLPGLVTPAGSDLLVDLQSPNAPDAGGGPARASLWEPDDVDRDMNGYMAADLTVRDAFVVDQACRDSDDATNADAPFTSDWMPNFAYTMNSFDYEYSPGGEDPNGQWKLVLTNYGATTATLNAWTLYVNGLPRQAWKPAPVELIEGWYGGPGLPSATFNGQFVPDGWLPPNAPASASDLYLHVVAPSCRACHGQRGGMRSDKLDFNSYADFMEFAPEIESLVYDKAQMPLAKRTYDRFWQSATQAHLLGQNLPGFSHGLPNGSVLKPGRPLADAGPNQKIATGTPARLRGSASLYADSYNWSFVLRPVGSGATLQNATTGNPSFFPDVAGDYVAQLVVSNGQGTSAGSTTKVTVGAGLGTYTGPDDALTIENNSCGLSGCHGTINTREWTYGDHRTTVDLVNLDEPAASPIFEKALGIRHCGGTRLDLAGQDAMIQWIMDGVPVF